MNAPWLSSLADVLRAGRRREHTERQVRPISPSKYRVGQRGRYLVNATHQSMATKRARNRRNNKLAAASRRRNRP